ncbi:hypothetical protein BH24CHL3_BH24CHL3_03940 [soil metagenome]
MTTGTPDLRLTRLASVLLVFLVLVSCSSSSSISLSPSTFDDCLATLSQPGSVTGLFVEPDDGHPPVIREIDSASCTVDVSIYILSDDVTIEALGNAVDRGIRVRVMLEEHPFGGGGGQIEVRERLELLGIEVRWSASDIRFSHAKYIVIDRQTALFMNQNLTASAFTSNREFGVTTTDRASVAQAQTVFDRDWDHDPLDDPDGPLIVSPTNSRARYLELIGGAERSIDFYAEVIRDVEIVDAIEDAAARGVQVRLIVDASFDEVTQEFAIQLYNSGAEIRLAETLYIHAKLMVIDGDLAIVGSQNFTSTSLDDNRELAIAIEDPTLLARCLVIFERDWVRSIPGAPT